MACSYRSITLQPGESFVLPAGSQIVGATDPNTITSVNDCADLDNLEDIGCYGFTVIAATGVDGSETEVWEDTQITFKGVTYNGVDYPFVTPVGYDGSAIATQLSLLPFGSTLTNICTSASNRPTRQSLKFYIIFNTLPSIANGLVLYGTTTSPNADPPSGFPQVPFQFPCRTRDAIVSDGNDNVCDCPAV